MASNPARTFALVNLAVFVLALAAFLWLRSRGTFDELSMSPTESTVQAADSTARPSTAGADGVPADAVEAASAAQLAFLREVLVDTAHALQDGFVVPSRRHRTAYYLGARVDAADTARSRVALWFMRGPRDAPRSVKALNALGEQYGLASRVNPSQEGVSATDVEARALIRYLTESEP